MTRKLLRQRLPVLAGILISIAVGCVSDQAVPGSSARDASETARTVIEEPPRTASLEPILGPGAGTMWKMPAPARGQKGPGYKIVRDEILGRDVMMIDAPRYLTIEGLTAYQGNIEVNCRLRLAADEKRTRVRASIAVAKDPADKKSRGHVVTLNGTYGGDLSIAAPKLHNARRQHSAPAMAGVKVLETPKNQGAKYTLVPYRTIPPTLPRATREAIEMDMSSQPSAQDKWVNVRFQLGTNWLRAWVDDRIVTDDASKDLKTSGVLVLSLGAGTRLGSVSVKPLPRQYEAYEAIRLGGYVRDRNLAGSGRKAVGVRRDALPFGQRVRIEDIPFEFVDPELSGGADHLDIGRSLVREGVMAGHRPVLSQGPRFAGAFLVDSSRIKLRLPNGRYDALHLIAAFDEAPGSIPLITAQFYRPRAGFSMIFEGTVPSFRAKAAIDAKPLPVALDDGSRANLWLVTIPLDPGMLSSFADLPYLEVELTKKTQQYRSYPDPIHYGWHGAGPPSGVHVYAVTLHRPRVHMELTPDVFGHVWPFGKTPKYNIKLECRGKEPRKVTLDLRTRSYDGKETDKQTKTLTIRPGRPSVLPFTFARLKKNGSHKIEVTLIDGDQSWTEKRNFIKLAKDTRPAQYDKSMGAQFGYWSYHGGHYTPPKEEIVRLMRLAGARAPSHPGNAWPVTPQWGWAAADPVDPAKYNAYKKDAVARIKKRQGDNPKLITFFPEPHISRNLTVGSLPSYWGEPEYKLDEKEQRSLRVFFNTAKAAAEGVREEWPNTKLLIPWGDPLFIVPLLRAGFPKELIDGSGLDNCGFERLPEQQLHQFSVHRLYMLREEYRKFGLPDPYLPYVEGIFVPTEPGATTWPEQANIYNRWTLMSMAYGITDFFSGWFAFDCGSYYGSEHYGGCGIQRRIPYCDPKPAYALYATMTRMLDGAKFEKWLPTGSHSTFCLKFDRPKAKGGPLLAIWTLRGKRSLTMTLPKDGAVIAVDGMDNATTLKTTDRQVTLETGPMVIYVSGAGEAEIVGLGAPDHSEAAAWARGRNRRTWQTGPLARGAEINHEQSLGTLGNGAWQIVEQKDDFDEVYENNNFDTSRYRGRMSLGVTTDPERPGPALAVKLLTQDPERKLMPYYTAIRPPTPIEIPGKAMALGLWVKAASDWGRMIYCMRDANDEMWISIGFKDQWNCDDVHSWSSFNFDGWRYLRFELPANAAWDGFREYGSTWWRFAGGKGKGIGEVDLPLRLEKIIVERRSHILYVNDIQPTRAEENDVLLGNLVAEYAASADATKQAIADNRRRMPLPKGKAVLPNPIKRMAADHELAAPKLQRAKQPDWGYDGTSCEVYFDEVEGAAQYQVWVAAHEDGSGAVAMGRMGKPGGLVRNLRPATKLYLWLTYTQALTEEDKKAKRKPKQSKPSNSLQVEFLDAFGLK